MSSMVEALPICLLRAMFGSVTLTCQSRIVCWASVSNSTCAGLSFTVSFRLSLRPKKLALPDS